LPVSGKYDFEGIKKTGARGLEILLASTTWGIWLLQWGFKPVTDFVLQFIVNWLANNGLMVLNIGAIYIEGKFDQRAFDNAMNDGIKQVENAKGKLTPEQIKAIDDEVRNAARKFIPYVRPK
jgi:hypothetical protein